MGGNGERITEGHSCIRELVCGCPFGSLVYIGHMGHRSQVTGHMNAKSTNYTI